jgi:hypothetical protein
MGLFKKKKDKTPDGMARPEKGASGFIAPPASNDPSLPGNAGWCGGAKTGEPMRFNYVRPDGKPDRERGVWSEEERR